MTKNQREQAKSSPQRSGRPGGKARYYPGRICRRFTVWVTEEMIIEDDLMMEELGLASRAELYRHYREFYMERRDEG